MLKPLVLKPYSSASISLTINIQAGTIVDALKCVLRLQFSCDCGKAGERSLEPSLYAHAAGLHIEMGKANQR